MSDKMAGRDLGFCGWRIWAEVRRGVIGGERQRSRSRQGVHVGLCTASAASASRLDCVTVPRAFHSAAPTCEGCHWP